MRGWRDHAKNEWRAWELGLGDGLPRYLRGLSIVAMMLWVGVVLGLLIIEQTGSHDAASRIDLGMAAALGLVVSALSAGAANVIERHQQRRLDGDDPDVP